MKRLHNFIKKSILGGFLVILPATIIFFSFRWAMNAVSELIHPLAAPISQRSGAPDFMVDLLVIALILLGCFIVGSIAATSGGQLLQGYADKLLSKLAPGYNLVREIIHQILGSNENSPFSRGDVARVKLYGSAIPTEVTAIVTSYHSNGWYTVFVPTGPNPTSGMIYHVPADQVVLLPMVKVDEAFRTIIACGAGSGEIFAKTSR